MYDLKQKTRTHVLIYYIYGSQITLSVFLLLLSNDHELNFLTMFLLQS